MREIGQLQGVLSAQAEVGRRCALRPASTPRPGRGLTSCPAGCVERGHPAQLPGARAEVTLSSTRSAG